MKIIVRISCCPVNLFDIFNFPSSSGRDIEMLFRHFLIIEQNSRPSQLRFLSVLPETNRSIEIDTWNWYFLSLIGCRYLCQKHLFNIFYLLYFLLARQDSVHVSWIFLILQEKNTALFQVKCTCIENKELSIKTSNLPHQASYWVISPITEQRFFSSFK